MVCMFGSPEGCRVVGGSISSVNDEYWWRTYILVNEMFEWFTANEKMAEKQGTPSPMDQGGAGCWPDLEEAKGKLYNPICVRVYSTHSRWYVMRQVLNICDG